MIIGIKLNRSDNVLYLVVTPARLKEAQPDGFRLQGAIGASSTFFCVCVIAWFIID